MKRRLIVCCALALAALTGCGLKPAVSRIESSSQAQGSEQGRKLADGTVIFNEAAISESTAVEFKDENGTLLIDNNDIVKVYMKFSEWNKHYLELELTENGQLEFKAATEENIGKAITISADDEILSAPTVQDVIESGNIVISSNQSREELTELFNKLTK